MPHRPPPPFAKRLLQVALIITLGLSTHCQKADQPPPPQPSSQVPASSDCCELEPATGLKAGMGRVVVAFPGESPHATRIAILSNGKEVAAGFGTQSLEVAPGTYDVVISNKHLVNVAVREGHDTTVKVGVLRINADTHTRSEVLDGDQVLAAGHGTHLVGLPVGSFEVRIAGQTETVTITDGQITDF